MNEAFQYLDILILAVIAGLVLLRLRSVLGRRTGHEKTDQSSFNYEATTKETRAKAEGEANLINKNQVTNDSWFNAKDFL